MALRTTLAALLTAPLLVLTACGDATSVADPPVAPSPTTASSTQPPKREEPQRFIARWFEVGTRMQNSGNTHEYRSMQRGCRGCLSVASHIKESYQAGGYYRTKGVRSLQVAVEKRLGNRCLLDVHVNLFPTSYKESRDGSLKSLHGGPARFQVMVMPRSDSWVVTNFVQVPS
ncbi:MAG: hypothetical protein QM747_10100 [Nocardioides sp.]